MLDPIATRHRPRDIKPRMYTITRLTGGVYDTLIKNCTWLSPAIRRALMVYGVSHLGTLCGMHPLELSYIPGIGEAKIALIHRGLLDQGLTLGTMTGKGADAHYTPSLGLPVAVTRRLMFAGFRTVGEVRRATPQELYWCCGMGLRQRRKIYFALRSFYESLGYVQPQYTTNLWKE